MEIGNNISWKVCSPLPSTEYNTDRRRGKRKRGDATNQGTSSAVMVIRTLSLYRIYVYHLHLKKV